MRSSLANVCVIVPAYCAQATIGRAVASALAEPEVAEVIVVDDASPDETSAAARRADDGSGRLTILRFDVNRGPSAARNAALAATQAEFVALLDADDYLLPGRFARLAPGGWDFLADNVAFVPDDAPRGLPAEAHLPDHRRDLTFGEFVDRNIARPDKPKGELGFLKPVMRRAAFARFRLAYDETLRLGEDFILYATALARGAVFQLSATCGYVAVMRAGSLSARHRTLDLQALAAADTALLAELDRNGSPAASVRILDRHRASLQDKINYRQFLDRKSDEGLLPATADLLRSPDQAVHVALSLFRDKTRRQAGSHNAKPRMLFSGADFDTRAAPG